MSRLDQGAAIRSPAILVPVVALFAGCGGTAGLVATAAPNPNMAVSAVVRFTAPAAADTFTVESGDTLAYGRTTPALAVSRFSAAGTREVTVPVFSLTPGATSHLRVTARSGAAVVAVSADVPVTMGALPSPFPSPAVNIPAPAGAPERYVLVSTGEPNHMPAQFGYAVILDREGRVVWYHKLRSIDADRRAYDFERKGPGLFTLFQADVLGFVDVNLFGDELPGALTDLAAPQGTDGHAIAFTADGRAVIAGFEPHVEDTSRFFGGGPGTTVFDAAFDLVDATGRSSLHWNSHSVIPVDDCDDTGLSTMQYQQLVWNSTRLGITYIDCPHPNAIALAPDGKSALLGLRDASQVVRLDLATGKVMARIGGKHGDYTFVNDPRGGFDHPHDDHLLPSGNLLVFDNSLIAKTSRVAEYALDDGKKTATLVWSADLPAVISFGGSARRTAGGNTVVGVPVLHLVDEFDASGKLVWQLDADWYALYRALPLDDGATIYD